MSGNVSRIAYIVDSFRPGGLERVVASLTSSIDHRRFEPIVISLTDCPAANWLDETVSVFELQKPPGNSFSTVRQLAQTLRKHRVELVHSHSWATLLETSIARKWAAVTYHVHAEHGTLPVDSRLSFVRKTIRSNAMRWGLRRSDAIVSVAESVTQRLCQFTGIAPAEVSLIPNGVLATRGTGDARKSLAISNEAILIGTVGRLVEVKDFEVLISAFALAKQKSTLELKLAIVGDGPEMPKLRSQVRQLGIVDDVFLVGMQSNVSDWLDAMDLYVNSSRSEGLSMAVLEAMGAGLPLILTDVGDHRKVSVSEPRSGIVVQPGDTEALGAAIVELAEYPEAARQYGNAAALKHGETYSIEAMVRRYEDLYLRVMGREVLNEQPVESL